MAANFIDGHGRTRNIAKWFIVVCRKYMVEEKRTIRWLIIVVDLSYDTTKKHQDQG